MANNPYAQLRGYKYTAHGANGSFVVFDGNSFGTQKPTGEERWVVKKMPDGPTRATKTLDQAKQLAILSADSVFSYDRWW